MGVQEARKNIYSGFWHKFLLEMRIFKNKNIFHDKEVVDEIHQNIPGNKRC
jgi:hypothetical protein